ncbi:afamin-like [Rhynchocyon petersi]
MEGIAADSNSGEGNESTQDWKRYYAPGEFGNHQFLYDFSRRHPFAFSLTLLVSAAHFEEVAKVAPVIQNLKAMSYYQNNVCGALMRFGPKVIRTMFLYEYGRRHQNLSIPELLRITEVYETLLKDCCGRENPPACYGHAEEKFNETTEKSLKMVKQECARFQNLGKDDLKYHYLVKLTKMAPQLSTEELTLLSKEISSVLDTCCAQSEQFACVDNLMHLLLGELCGVNKNRTINAAVDQCCKSSFAFRRHCFEDIKADDTYVPTSSSQDLFTFNTDLCQAQNGTLESRKDRVQN